MADVVYRVRPPLKNDALNALFELAWPHHKAYDFTRTLAVCLTYIGAFTGDAFAGGAFTDDSELIGFVKVAWDGDTHGFLLDPTVHPAWQRQGIGRELVRKAAEDARQHGLAWLHVDYEPTLESFYAGCGFVSTHAGLINLVHPFNQTSFD